MVFMLFNVPRSAIIPKKYVQLKMYIYIEY